jgi:hypothetical protein
MRALTLIAVLLIAPALAAAEDAGQVRVGSTDLSMVPPRDFAPSKTFTGFEYPKAEASIRVTELKAGIGQFIVGMTDERMKKQGMTVLTREQVEVNHLTGLLLSISQEDRGRAYRKWMLVIGNQQTSTLLVAAFPEERQAELSRAMRQSLLTARTGARDEAANEDSSPTAADPLSGMPFTIEAAKPLKQAQVLGKMVSFTRGGVIPVARPGDPLFVVGPSTSAAAPADRKAYALARIKATATVADLEVESVQAVTIGGLSGFEIVARANHDPSRTPLLVYQVMLFTDSSYFLMTGMGLRNSEPSFLVPFRKMAKSFKRK